MKVISDWYHAGMELTVREAAPSDAEAMRRLAEKADTAAHWREQDYAKIFDRTAQERVAFVVEQGSRISGFVVASCAGQEWEIENVVVASETRRSGLADRLMAELLERAARAGAESIFLEVRQSNEAAGALYRKWGFAEIGKRKGYYSAPVEDAVLYRKSLQTGSYSAKHL